MASDHAPADQAPATSDSLQLEAYGLYCALTDAAARVNADGQEIERNSGGKLLYAGELDAPGRAMVIAGNVSGCATLGATADLAAQKQIIRDGVVDFVVTSLDEALRILKNEIRKRATVAVCVGAAPAVVEREMTERGVLPDLVFAGLPGAPRNLPHFGPGAREIEFTGPDRGQAFISWQVAQSPARWMAQLDAMAIACLAADWRAKRWLRLSPRYCGRSAQSRRALYCDAESARQIFDRFAASVRGGEIETEVVAKLIIDDETTNFRLSPLRSA